MAIQYSLPFMSTVATSGAHIDITALSTDMVLIFAKTFASYIVL